MKRSLILPPRDCLQDVLAVHDATYLALHDPVAMDFLAHSVAGLYSTLKARGSLMSEEGARAWRYALESLPAGAVEYAFADWLRNEEWMPTPSEIREKALAKAGTMEAIHHDCRTVLLAWAES